jgi:DNA repair exonuclease SbcCD ATPase subunit
MSTPPQGQGLLNVALELATHLRAFVAQPARRAEVRKAIDSMISALPAPKNVTDPVQDVRAFGAALVALMDRYMMLEEGSAAAARAGDSAKRLESEISSLRSTLDAAERKSKTEWERASQLAEKHRVLELQVARDYVPVGEVKRLKDDYLKVDEARVAAERRLQQYVLSGDTSRDRISDLEAQVAEARSTAARLEQELKTKEAEIEWARAERTSTAAEEAKQWFNSQLKALQGENRRVNDLLAEAKKESEAAKAQAETEAAKTKAELEMIKGALEKAEGEARAVASRLESDYVPKRLLEEREQAHVWRERELEAKLKEAEAKAAAREAAPADSSAKEEEITRLKNKLIEDRVAYDSWVAQLELSNSQLKEHVRQLKAGGVAPQTPTSPGGGPAPAKK